ncbi:hypothetical protein GCM10010381_26430 [Streptomyces xantholiticus]|nr:hypothetical protein GCM10010381_26430 [Streptomyces xantholiticus]
MRGASRERDVSRCRGCSVPADSRRHAMHGNCGALPERADRVGLRVSPAALLPSRAPRTTRSPKGLLPTPLVTPALGETP